MKTSQTSWWREAGFVSLLALLVLLTFGQAITFEFLMWDDDAYVLPHVQREQGLSLASVKWAFTNHENGWRTPLPYLSFFADVELWGLNAAGFHLTNLVLHFLSTVVLYVFARRTFAGRGWAFFAAALFAIHPLHVEPVAWVTGRWELLCGLFFLLGMVAYEHYCRTPSFARMALVATCFLLAMLSKPMALTFPFALLLLDIWPMGRLRVARLPGVAAGQPCDRPHFPYRRPTWAWAVCEKVPLFAITALGLAISFTAKTDFLNDRTMVSFPLWARLINGVETYAIYTVQLFWPRNLSFFYPHPLTSNGFSWLRVVASLLLVSGVTALAVRQWRRCPYAAAGWFFFLGVFVPAIGLFQVDYHARADRYTYIPLIGLVLLLAEVGRQLHRRPALTRVTFAAAGCFLLLLMVSARVQTRHWKSNEALFTHGMRVDPHNLKARTNLATLASRAGDYEVAIEHLGYVLRKMPGHAIALHNLGTVYFRQQQYERAVSIFERLSKAAAPRSRALIMLARCHERLGRLDATLTTLERAVRQFPNEMIVHYFLGNYLAGQNQWSRAARAFSRAAELNPFHPDLPKRVGVAFYEAGEFDAYHAYYRDFLAKHPRRADIADYYCWNLATHWDHRIRRPRLALQLAERLTERYGTAEPALLDTVAAVYAANERFDDAVAALRRAIELARDDESHHRHQAQMQARLVLYKAQQPWRQQAEKSNATDAHHRDPLTVSAPAQTDVNDSPKSERSNHDASSYLDNSANRPPVDTSIDDTDL